MALLQRYEDFIERVDELGFMALSNMLEGFPSLTGETPRENWHTGEPDTDPWCWKDRAAAEKRLAFGCILGGNKGFVSAGMYSMFYKAFNPPGHMEERRAAGMVSQATWQIWQLFEEKALLDTGDIRHIMGVTKKKGGSRVDRSIEELQQFFYITVAGNRRKTDKFGQPYGWAANVYDKVESWAPADWMKLNSGIDREEALERILERGITIGSNVNREDLVKTLGVK